MRVGDPVRVEVLGEPKPQGSVRAINAGGKARVIHGSGMAGWRNIVADAIAGSWDEPTEPDGLAVHMQFCFHRPKSHPKWQGNVWPFHVKRPDLDKLVRTILDAIVAAGVVTDDAKVFYLSAEKRYLVDGDLQQRAQVIIIPYYMEKP
jgi:Holliday junction resolvase RusA-like endonuclease